jgi:hypothetical protein
MTVSQVDRPDDIVALDVRIYLNIRSIPQDEKQGP